jgi:hypothetical protein
MTPSDTITSGQAGKVGDLLSDALRKSGLPNAPTQQIIEEEGAQLTAELVAVVRKRVEARSEIITRPVSLDPERTNAQVIEETGRKPYVDRNVLDNLTRASFTEGEVIFVPLRVGMSDKKVDEMLDSMNLVPATFDAVAKVNEDDPAFADTHPNFAHEQDAKGKWCYATFGQWRGDERYVDVLRDDDGWDDDWWVGAVRKPVPSDL